jgi:hypothetical protein
MQTDELTAPTATSVRRQMLRRWVVRIIVVVALQTTLGVLWAMDLHKHQVAICRAMQRLDGRTYDSAVINTIHEAGRRAARLHPMFHLAGIARSADGTSWPGHLSMISEDYDYVASACYEVRTRIPNVD